MIDESSTYKWGDTDTVGRTSVQVLVVIDTSQVDDGIYEVTLLWTAIHEIGVGDLDWSRKAMVGGDVLGTFCCLLGIWWGEGFGL